MRKRDILQYRNYSDEPKYIYPDIIQDEILCGIDRALHDVAKYYIPSVNPYGGTYERCKMLGERLKEILPEYINNQVENIGKIWKNDLVE